MVVETTNRSGLVATYANAVGDQDAWRAPSYQFSQNNGRVHFLNGIKEIDGSLTPRAGSKSFMSALSDAFSIVGGWLSPKDGRTGMDQASLAMERAGWSDANSSNDGYKNDFVYAAHNRANEAAPDTPYTFQPTGLNDTTPSGMGGQ